MEKNQPQYAFAMVRTSRKAKLLNIRSVQFPDYCSQTYVRNRTRQTSHNRTRFIKIGSCLGCLVCRSVSVAYYTVAKTQVSVNNESIYENTPPPPTHTHAHTFFLLENLRKAT